MGKGKRVAPNASLPAEAMTQAERFVDSMLLQGHSFTSIMDNFRLVTIKRALDQTRSTTFPTGCVERAAKALKTHPNVLWMRLRESPDFFESNGLGRKRA